MGKKVNAVTKEDGFAMPSSEILQLSRILPPSISETFKCKTLFVSFDALENPIDDKLFEKLFQNCKNQHHLIILSIANLQMQDTVSCVEHCLKIINGKYTYIWVNSDETIRSNISYQSILIFVREPYNQYLKQFHHIYIKSRAYILDDIKDVLPLLKMPSDSKKEHDVPACPLSGVNSNSVLKNTATASSSTIHPNHLVAVFFVICGVPMCTISVFIQAPEQVKHSSVAQIWKEQIVASMIHDTKLQALKLNLPQEIINWHYLILCGLRNVQCEPSRGIRVSCNSSKYNPYRRDENIWTVKGHRFIQLSSSNSLAEMLTGRFDFHIPSSKSIHLLRAQLSEVKGLCVNPIVEIEPTHVVLPPIMACEVIDIKFSIKNLDMKMPVMFFLFHQDSNSQLHRLSALMDPSYVQLSSNYSRLATFVPWRLASKSKRESTEFASASSKFKKSFTRDANTTENLCDSQVAFSLSRKDLVPKESLSRSSIKFEQHKNEVYTLRTNDTVSHASKNFFGRKHITKGSYLDRSFEAIPAEGVILPGDTKTIQIRIFLPESVVTPIEFASLTFKIQVNNNPSHHTFTISTSILPSVYGLSLQDLSKIGDGRLKPLAIQKENITGHALKTAINSNAENNSKSQGFKQKRLLLISRMKKMSFMPDFWADESCHDVIFPIPKEIWWLICHLATHITTNPAYQQYVSDGECTEQDSDDITKKRVDCNISVMSFLKKYLNAQFPDLMETDIAQTFETSIHPFPTTSDEDSVEFVKMCVESSVAIPSEVPAYYVLKVLEQWGISLPDTLIPHSAASEISNNCEHSHCRAILSSMSTIQQNVVIAILSVIREITEIFESHPIDTLLFYRSIILWLARWLLRETPTESAIPVISHFLGGPPVVATEHFAE